VAKPRSYTCSTCAVLVRWAPGHEGGPPARWVRRGRAWLCVVCQRAEAREQAAEGEEAAAVASLELIADAARTDSKIAKAAGITIVTVRAARQRLLADGVIVKAGTRKPRTKAGKGSPPPPRRGRSGGRTSARAAAPKPRPRTAKRRPYRRFAAAAVARELRANPLRANLAVARAAGEPETVSVRHAVARLRRQLEEAGEIERYRAVGGAPMHRATHRMRKP
jgi:hypothetical protein